MTAVHEEKTWGGLVDCKLNMSQPCDVTAETSNTITNCINQKGAARSREAITVLLSQIVRPPLEYSVQL